MSAKNFVTAEIPFVTVGNRRALTGLQLMQEPWLVEFMKRFPQSFEHSPQYDAVFFIEPDGQKAA